jgi:hypothetical protein
LADIAPIGGWCSPVICELQSNDVESVWVRTSVEKNMRTANIDLALWDKLKVQDVVLVLDVQGTREAVLHLLHL